MSVSVLAGLLVVLGVIAVAAWSFLGGRRKARTRRPPYIAALGALVDGDDETAMAELKAAVRQDTNNVDAYLRLGDLFRRRGDNERAYQLHRELASRPGLPKDEMAKVQIALSRDHHALERLQRSADAAREAVRLSVDPQEALEQLLEVQEEQGDVAGAFQTKKEILKRGGRTREGTRELADYRARQGEALLAAGDLKDAERVLKEARKLDSSSQAAKRSWGRLRERLGDYAGAVEAWDGDAEMFADLERVRFLDGSFSEMEDTYSRFLEKSPGHEGAAFGLARFLRRKGQTDSALDVCRRALSQHPESTDLRVLLLSLLLQSGRTGEAEAALNDWISDRMGEGKNHPEPGHAVAEPGA
ncbi:MAG TPA: tetratricopeptide repeat protein [bacterium]|nr:tetratricopeptide repeat protein [bacterium]